MRSGTAGGRLIEGEAVIAATHQVQLAIQDLDALGEDDELDLRLTGGGTGLIGAGIVVEVTAVPTPGLSFR